jgi:pyrroline-5-carboxylate reductase
MEQRKVGILGGGNMAAAILEGLVKSGALASPSIQCTDTSKERRELLSTQYAIRTHEDNKALVEWADCVVLAVKPQALSRALQPAWAAWRADHLVISICAGVTLETIAKQVGSVPRLVRAMPNTPALVGAGATAIALGAGVTAADAAFARGLFECVGTCVELDERYLDAVTGLSGSGPGYVMLFIEALADGGVRAGLPRATALQLAAQTVFGSAKLLLEGGQHPGQLKDQVTSPGGTTIEGIFALESGGFRAAVIDAVCKATDRSRALGK